MLEKPLDGKREGLVCIFSVLCQATLAGIFIHSNVYMKSGIRATLDWQGMNLEHGFASVTWGKACRRFNAGPIKWHEDDLSSCSGSAVSLEGQFDNV